MLQFIPGTDFITSGFGAIPRYDNMFGGGDFDVTELDDWYVLQRDMQIDGGIVPVREDEVLRVRELGARAVQAVFGALNFAPISDAEVAAAITAFSSQDMPDRDRIADIESAMSLLEGSLTVMDVIKALENEGYRDIAENVLEMQRQRARGDYLQPSAIFDKNFQVKSALTDPNDYCGPGTGYRVEGERWSALQDLPQAWEPRNYLEKIISQDETPWFEESGPAQIGKQPEVVIALSPTFGVQIRQSLGGLNLREVLLSILNSIREEGITSRIIRVFHTSDVAFIGHCGAQLSGSGVAIGMQSKGTTVIHHRDLTPLENLELFPQAPNMDLDNYSQIGRNAARYALEKQTSPVAVKIDNTVRLRLIVQTALLQRFEANCIQPDRQPVELKMI